MNLLLLITTAFLASATEGGAIARAYVSSTADEVVVTCPETKTAISGTCYFEERLRLSNSPHRIVIIESSATADKNGWKCKPSHLRADQLILLIAQVECGG
jgi:hypothetical protein